MDKCKCPRVDKNSFFLIYFSWEITAVITRKEVENNWLPVSYQLPFQVIPPRFERGTHSLEGCCSIQLSYGTILIATSDSAATRTQNPRLRRAMLYPVELRNHPCLRLQRYDFLLNLQIFSNKKITIIKNQIAFIS